MDDIICHLDGTIAPALCQGRFESCADIVIPHSMQIPLADPDAEATTEATAVPPSDLSPFLFLLGLADMAEDGDHGNGGGGLIPDLTSNVLSSINDVFDGIQITPLGNDTIHDIMHDNNTINIFQNVQIIFDDTTDGDGEEGDSNNHTMVFMVNGTGVRVDITDPAIVFDPSSLVVQG